MIMVMSYILKFFMQGSFQVFVNVLHVSDLTSHRQGLGNVDMKLIDNIFLEFTGLVALPFEQVSFVRTLLQEGTGDFGRSTIRVGVNAICAQGFNGSDCGTFCEEINGTLICEQGIYMSVVIIIGIDSV